jgi:hypothetical protein
MKVHAENAEGLQGSAERFLAAAAAAKGSLSGRSSGGGGKEVMRVPLLVKLHLILMKTLVSLRMTTKIVSVRDY